MKPYRHSSTAANTERPVKIIQCSSAPLSGVSVPDDTACVPLIALMLVQLPENGLSRSVIANKSSGVS